MRNLMLLLSSLLLINVVFSQSTTKEDVLKKSKNQKTTAWILLGTGAAAFITGALIDNSHRDDNTQSFTGGYLEISGIISGLASIPFFIGSSKNKKRATALTFNIRKEILTINNSFVVSTYPTLGLRIVGFSKLRPSKV